MAESKRSVPAAKRRRMLWIALAFLLPNIIGVLTFTVFPVVFSLLMSFTNWDLTQHNMFKDATPRFVGLDNYVELISGDKFLRFFGNTLFFMMSIPVGIMLSLMAAILLSKNVRAGGGRPYAWLLATAVLVASCAVLAAVGLGKTGMTILLVSTAACILLAGVTGGLTFYRTLFYTPHFVGGVATFILWKKLYGKDSGPVNAALQPVLDVVGSTANATPVLFTVLAWLGVTLLLSVLALGLRRLRIMWTDGDLGSSAAVLPVILMLIPVAASVLWRFAEPYRPVLVGGTGLVLAYHFIYAWKASEKFPAPHRNEGFGNGLVLSMLLMAGQFILLGLLAAAGNTPGMAADGGLEAPSWLNDTRFAKPALMIMGIWGAVGSNSMLLYLAALTNVPGELYEAADIDGASAFQRFWNVTWPQLAPTTFFISVMGVMGGLQGGFEMARVMTEGGPAGATTTLSYFIYQEGFETGRLGYASAVSWALFILVFGVTMFNWKFGNKYVND
ncbi:MAG: sugar ABC transporter permease [Planctomycetota bacterium]